MTGSRAMTGVRQMGARVRMLGKVPRIAPPLSAHCLENQLAHAVQRVEHAVAAHRDRLDVGGVTHPLPPGLLDQMLARMGGVRRHLLLSRVVDRPPGIQRGLEVLDRGGVREVALVRSEEHTSELQSPCNLVCRLLLEKKKKSNDSQLNNLQLR